MAKRTPLDKAIDEIPGGDGWWHPHNGDTYRALGRDLVALGATEEAAVEILSRAYGAAADEFGS